MDKTRFRYTAIAYQPDGTRLVMSYDGPAWRIAGAQGFQRLLEDVTGGATLQSLFDLEHYIPGMRVRVVDGPGRLYRRAPGTPSSSPSPSDAVSAPDG